MAIVDTPQEPQKGAMWTSPERIYADKAGAVVPAGSTDAAFLLVAAGGQLPMAKAIELGLVKTSSEEVAIEEKAEESASDKAEPQAEDKAVKPAKDKGK